MSDRQLAPGTRWGARSIASLLIFILAAAADAHRPGRPLGPPHGDRQRALHRDGRSAHRAARGAGGGRPVGDRRRHRQGRHDRPRWRGCSPSLFPDSAFTEQLASPIAAGINGLIGELVTKFVASDQFATVWIELNTLAQRGLVAILEGGQEGPVQIVGDDVVLDISSALATIQTYLVDNGISAAANVTVPESDRQIVLMSTPALSQIRFVYSLTSPVLQWFPLVVAAMFALSIALARRRPRTVRRDGVRARGRRDACSSWPGRRPGAFVNELSGTPVRRCRRRLLGDPLHLPRRRHAGLAGSGPGRHR